MNAKQQREWEDDVTQPCTFPQPLAEVLTRENRELRAEVERQGRLVTYLNERRAELEAMAADAQADSRSLGPKLLDETLRADREEARAESAEAEVERLRGGIRALADEWDREDAAYWEFIHQPNVERAIDAAKYSIVTDLRALLSPSPAATTGEACVHVWEAEYLPDPMSAGSVISSGDDFCTECGVTKDATRPASWVHVLRGGA